MKAKMGHGEGKGATEKSYGRWTVRAAFILLIPVMVMLTPETLRSAQTIIDEWDTVKTPPPPELRPVTIDPKTTALLLLDFNKQTCNAERRPRCIASLPKVKRLLEEARAKGAP